MAIQIVPHRTAPLRPVLFCIKAPGTRANCQSGLAAPAPRAPQLRQMKPSRYTKALFPYQSPPRIALDNQTCVGKDAHPSFPPIPASVVAPSDLRRVQYYQWEDNYTTVSLPASHVRHAMLATSPE